MKTNLLFIITLIASTSVCDTISQLLLKSSINKLEFNVSGIGKLLRFILHLVLIPRVWISGLFSLLSLLIWLFVLSKVDLNFAFSIDSMHYILIAFGSGIILKEKIGKMRWLGTLFIVFGIILVTIS